MIAQLAIATAMVLLTVAIHGGGIIALVRLMRLEAAEERSSHIMHASWRGFLFVLTLVLGLFALHGIEIWLYALLYLLGGALGDLEHAVYFSTITYATIGYDDQGLAQAWRLVAAIEGINGVILLGWSTAFFVTVVGRLGRR
ncbi:ion channel [Stakelama marina]|uniref:Two pore domain potassium channel family protein n=1 Tax=Stakelama marina TaxID=2826939 RepID=A0A8T4IET7_9SPHN|nr:ion channel [Stakelama marina]MBR0553073.1 two pore domain potassium channel family protein [Stakelama marina]